MIDQIQQVIPASHKILSIIDLFSFDNKSQKELYDILRVLHKTEYRDNELIVFYCLSPLTRKFEDLPAETLINLQKMLVYIDIPNFFCVVVTNDTNMQKDLAYVCEHYAVDEKPINTILYKDV